MQSTTHLTVRCSVHPPQLLFYKKGGRLSALFHPYLCGRIAAEWLINMYELDRILSPLPMDERIAYTTANCNGAHGCGCYRYEQYESEEDAKKYGYEDLRCERLDDLVNVVPYWLGPEMKKFVGHEAELPHDMHFMKVFVAPRFLLETEALSDIWGNPRGSYQTFLAAQKAYRLLGCEDNISALYREGEHGHRFVDFVAVMDYMDCKRYDKPLPKQYIANPFPDMKPIPSE